MPALVDFASVQNCCSAPCSRYGNVVNYQHCFIKRTHRHFIRVCLWKYICHFEIAKLTFAEIPTHVWIIPGFGDARAGKCLTVPQYIPFFILFLCNSFPDLPLEDGKKAYILDAKERKLTLTWSLFFQCQ